MLIKSCLTCNFHEISEEGNEKKSRCIKENCYAEFSKCIAKRALHQFLEDEKTESTHSTPRSEARGMLRVDTERGF
jgi:hypothetical protein